MEICMQQVNNSGAVWDKGTGIDRIRIRQREKFNLYNNWDFRKSYRDDSRIFLFGKGVRALSLNTHNSHTLHANCPWRGEWGLVKQLFLTMCNATFCWSLIILHISVSKILTPSLFLTTFQGCFYNEDPWTTEKVSLSGTNSRKVYCSV